MKGRKHELNYTFDPAAVSDPACWLPVGIDRLIGSKIALLRHMPALPPTAAIGVLDISDSNDPQICNSTKRNGLLH